MSGRFITNLDMWREAQEVPVEGRKDPWTMTEWGNWVADGIAGRARKIAEKEEQEWVALVDTWNGEVDRRKIGWAG